MERNDIDCQGCGHSIFNGFMHWMVDSAFQCMKEPKEASIIVELNCTTEIAVAIYLERRNDLTICEEI